MYSKLVCFSVLLMLNGSVYVNCSSGPSSNNNNPQGRLHCFRKDPFMSMNPFDYNNKLLKNGMSYEELTFAEDRFNHFLTYVKGQQSTSSTNTYTTAQLPADKIFNAEKNTHRNLAIFNSIFFGIFALIGTKSMHLIFQLAKANPVNIELLNEKKFLLSCCSFITISTGLLAAIHITSISDNILCYRLLKRYHMEYSNAMKNQQSPS